MTPLTGLPPDFSKFLLVEMPGEIAVYNDQFQFLYVSPGAIRNPEYRRWIIGKTDLEYCEYRKRPVEIATNRLIKLENVLKTGISEQWEENIPDENGTVRVYSRKLSRVIFKDNNSIYLVGTSLEITEVIKMQEDLRRQNEFLDLILNTSPQLIFVRDENQKFLLANKASADAIGVPLNEVTAKLNELEIFSKASHKEFIEIDKKVLEEDITIRREESIMRPDGSVIWYDTIKTPLHDKDGTKKVLGISTNITEQKLNEEKARQRERELTDAQELTKSGNWRLDLDTQKLEGSPGLYKLLEIEENTLLTLEVITTLCSENYRASFLEAVKNARAFGNESRLELVFNLTSGPKPVIATVRLNGKNSHPGLILFGTLLDVTEQKKFENELHHKDQRLLLVSKLGRTGSFEFDLRNHKVDWSSGIFEIFEKDIATGSPTVEEYMEHVMPEDIPIVQKILEDIPKANEQLAAEYRILTYTGKTKYVKIITYPEFDENGKIVKIIGSTNDITDQKNTERELRLHRQHLEEAQDLARLGSWRLTLPDNKIWWSAGCYNIWERDPKLGAPTIEEFQQTIHPEDRERIAESMAEVLAKGIGNVIDYRIITTSGQTKYLYVRSKPAYDAEGNVEYLFGTLIDISELKQAELKLQRSEDRLNEAQKLANIGSWEYDYVNNETFWSEGHYKLWERDIKLKPLTYEDFLLTIHPDDRHLIESRSERILSSGGREEVEYRVQLPSGREAIMHSVAIAEMTSDKQLKKLFGTVIDITERREAERLIRQSEESLAEAQTLSRIGSWEYELANKKLTWSAGMYDLWKRDKNLAPPNYREFLNTVHPDDRLQVQEMFNAIYETGIKREVEFRIIASDHQWYCTHSRVFARKNEEGVITSLHGTIMDISERKRNEELLKESERSLVEAQEMSRSGNFSIHLPDGKIFWSPGMYKLTEWTEKTPPTIEQYSSWIRPDDTGKMQQYHEKRTSNDESSEVEYELNLPSGRKIIILARSKAIKDANGKIVQISGTATDITQQAEAQKILIEMKDRSEEMIRAKEYFLANISHELKTPLNGILGMARLLRKTDLNSTQRKYTDILNSTAGNLLVIINDILDVAKIESGKLSLEKIPFDPLKVADQAVQVQLYKAEEKDLILRHLHVGPPLPEVEGDPFRLNQILLNLLSNAIKFTSTGEVILTHRILSEREEEVTIEFSVQDTGIGIAPEKAGKIFESFMQVHDQTQAHYGGTGLGLTISRTLVEMQGGTINVRSELGKGSTFYFTIPYPKSKGGKISTTEDQRIEIKNLGALRILLAEDNRVNQFITEAMLLDWGFKVDVADNGIEALELVKKGDYDLILMDIQMPGLSGIEATKAIRTMPDVRKSKIPIIALTANTTKIAQRKFLAEGMNDCLVKPFKEEALFRRIIHQLEGEDRLKLAYKQKRFPTRKQPVPSGEQLYNLDLLRKDARNNTQFIKKMLQIFMDTIPPIIERMSEHFDKGEMDAISTLAHKIKPTLDGTGISSLHETIRNMENYREKKRTSDQMQNDLHRLRDIIGAVTAEFEKELGKLND